MDASIEAACCKVYGSEAMFGAINDCIQVRTGCCGVVVFWLIAAGDHQQCDSNRR